jgi:sugar phosphate isomerase/epimerase
VLVTRFEDSLAMLLEGGLDASLLVVENLDYPLEWISSLIQAMGLSYCLDIGHMLFYDFDIQACIEDFCKRTGAFHLHGVVDGEDHRGIEGIGVRDWEIVASALASYAGSVSLEVFSLKDLKSSMVRMAGLVGWKQEQDQRS